ADAPPLDRTAPYLYYQPEVLRYLEAVSLVGAPPVTVQPALALTAADLRAAAGVPDPRPGPLVVVHPGASDPRRRWPASSFARVGDALARAGAGVVVVGDAAERPLVDEVAGLMSAPAPACAGGLSLPGLVGLLGRATLVVGNDSGPLHLAEAVGTATVGVYWCGNLLTAGPVTRRRHRPVVSWRLACPVCGVDCTAGSCPHDASFVAEVPVGQVRGPALELLAAERGGSAAACRPAI
ncbi:MAG TPA: glycosyltransferase family 9 protein, partial [Frankiaceae bacterium]|nr:glycosyltransferase family 9 protein [Frankiaceae bacterium]